MTRIRQYPMVAGTSTTEGEASYVVDGSFAPFRDWDAVTNGQTVRYVATDGAQFEEGYGVKSTGPTLTRATILRNSSGDTTKIDWGTGTRTVYVVPDIDTVYEADDGTFVRMLKAPQVESDDAGDVTRKFRLWTSSGILYLSVSSESPFDHILRYNAAAGTPTLELDQPTNFAAAPSIAGNAVTAIATASFADTSAAQAGSSATVVMNPARTADAIATDTLLIGNRTSAASANATDEVVVKLTGGGLRRLLLSAIKSYVNAPDFTSSELSLSSPETSAAHGLDVAPSHVEAVLVCTTDDIGFSASANGGARVLLMTDDSGNENRTIGIGYDSVNVWANIPATLRLRRRDTGVVTAITYASWRIVFRAWK